MTFVAQSVGVQDLRKGGSWFDLRLGQYSFRGLMMAISRYNMLVLGQTFK